MDDVELTSVNSNTPLTRTLVKEDFDAEEIKVETPKGKVVVVVKGDRSKPALLTYHDLGLNSVSNFQSFFNFPDMAEITRHFCVYHLNAPGQEDGASVLPDSYEYPGMDDLAEQVNEVINELKVVKYVGIGAGMGGNVLLRHCRAYPERVDCLMLVSTLCTTAGWIEWGYQKRSISHLRNHGITQAVMDYLLWHHFGYNYHDRAHDLVNVYKQHFEHDIQPSNLAKLCEQYIWRTAVVIDREFTLENQGGDVKTLQVPVLNISGAFSPFLDETVTLNGKLNPQTSSWMKIQDCAMVLEEQPAKASEAFRLFVQGQGYCLNIRKSSAVGMVQ